MYNECYKLLLQNLNEMKKIYTTIFLIVAVTTTHLFGQCMLYPVSLVQRVNSSQIIIEGKVTSKKSFWNSGHNYIYTSNLIQVNQRLKGSLTNSVIEVITEGGEVGLNRQTAEPSLQLKVDDEGVFMLNSYNQPSQFGYTVYQPYSDNQGFVKFNLTENSASDPFNVYPNINTDLYKAIGNIMNITIPDFYNAAANNKFSAPSSINAAIVGISPTTLPAGTFSVLTITGSGFGAGPSATSFVEFPDADAGSGYIQPNAVQYVSWTSTQIQVQVPTKTSGSGTAGTGQIRLTIASSATVSAQTLTIPYGHLNVLSTAASPTTMYNTRHVDLNGSGGITWQMYTGFDALAAPKASFLRAFQTWRCGTYINWQLGPTVATNSIGLDGVDVIRFDIGSELPAGVLGRCTSYWSGCGSNPNQNWFVSELDIAFDDGTTWQYGPAFPTGSQYDFESVAVHELGHGHQLSHVISTVDFMNYAISNAAYNRTLTPTGDLAGGQAVMTRNLSGGVCSKPIMTALNSTNCIVAVPTASFTFANPVCVGQLVTFTNLSSGSPTSNSWTITGGSPATSTISNATTTYAAPGPYTITLIATNGLGSSSPLSKTITVLASPTIAVTSASICPGKTTTLTASGSTAGYTWTPGPLTGSSQALSPASTTIYTVVGSNGTCTNSSTGTVTVLPGANVNVPNAFICAGSPTLMTATGATTYTWNPGNLTGASQTYSPSSTTVYTVTGSVGTCTNVKTFTITTTTTLNVNISPNNATICVGQTTVLTASGASSYTWNTSANTTTILASNASNTTYSVVGQTGSCSGTALATVNVSTCATGISQNSLNDLIRIYPNPTENSVTINFIDSFSGTITVYNAIGQLISNKKIIDKNQTQIDLLNQANGIYIFKITSDNSSEKIIKVIKQ
jgi:PKD repeat protein